MEAEAAPHDMRSREILARVQAVFSEKGFDGASMQDLARAAAMSAGNFYRYFPSKSAIVEALVQANINDAELDLKRVIQSHDPHQAVRDLVRKHVEDIDCGKGPIWAEIRAASFRRPEIAALMQRMEARMCRNIVEMFAHIHAITVATAEQRYAPQAKLIMLLIHGYTVTASRNEAGSKAGNDRQLEALVIAMIEDTVIGLAGIETKAALRRKAS